MMQEHSPSQHPSHPPSKQTAWFIVSIAPTFLALLGTTITLLAYFQLWGGSTRVSTVLGVFFSEITLVVTAFGLLAYLRTHNKTKRTKNIARFNWCIVAYAVTAGLYLFLS